MVYNKDQGELFLPLAQLYFIGCKETNIYQLKEMSRTLLPKEEGMGHGLCQSGRFNLLFHY
jgi:hypothetical protein